MNVIKLYYYTNERINSIRLGTVATPREITYKEAQTPSAKSKYDKYVPAEGVKIDKFILNGDDEDEGDEPKARTKYFNTKLKFEINRSIHLVNSDVVIHIRSMQSVNQLIKKTYKIKVGDNNTLTIDLSDLNVNLIYNMELHFSSIVYPILFRI